MSEETWRQLITDCGFTRYRKCSYCTGTLTEYFKNSAGVKLIVKPNRKKFYIKTPSAGQVIRAPLSEIGNALTLVG